MIYEMLGGLPPFYSENFNIMYERILRAPLEFKAAECFTPASRALIEGMLQKEPTLRLGSSEADGNDIKSHAWFQPIDWAALDRREIKPSFVPSVASELDTSNFDDEFTSQPARDSVAELASFPKASKAPTNFDGFTYVDTGHLNIS